MKGDAEDVPSSHASVKSYVTESVDYEEPKAIFDDDYIILDQKKVPQNVIERIEQRTIKVNRKLKKVFGNKEAL